MATQRFSQFVVEAVTDASPLFRSSQFVVEAVTAARPEMRVSQFVIELVVKTTREGFARVSGSGNVSSVGRMGCQCVRKISGECEHSTDVPETEIIGAPTDWSACIDGFPIECT